MRLHCNLLCSSANKTLSSAVPDRGCSCSWVLALVVFSCCISRIARLIRIIQQIGIRAWSIYLALRNSKKMGSTRFDLEKFNGENDFYLWSLKIRAILIQQGLDSALEEDEDSKDGTALKDHLDEFNKLILDLENVNIDLEDEDRALILLSSLPDSYEHFVDTLLYGRQTLTLKDVKNALESKDLKRRIDGKDLNPAESLVARAKPDKKFNKDKKNNNQKDKGDKKKKKRNCYFCHKEGHYIKVCFEKKRLEKLQKETNGKAAVASEDEGISDDADVLIAAEKQPSGEWILDSGCSFHMCPNMDFFKTFEQVDGGKVLLGNNLACKVAGIGTINIMIFDGIERDLKQIEENGLVIMKGIRRNGLYVLTGSTAEPAITASVSSDRTKLWHMRLAHMSEKGMKEPSKQGLLGNDQITSLQFCEKCVFGKATRHRFNPGKKETKQTLDYVHSDLWGPSQVPSHGGARYFITFIDDYSRRVWVYVLKHKNEAFERFKEWIALMENQTERRLKRLRTDNGLEYCNKDFENFSYAHISQGKLEPRAVKGYFIGYPEGIKGYKIWCLDGKPSRTLISRDVVFDEEAMLQQKVESKDILKESEKITESHHGVSKASELDNYQLARDRERRVVKMPKRYGIADLISFALMVADEMTGEEPENFKQAMNSRDNGKWLSAMEDEMISLKKNNTWVLVQRPAGKRLVGCKWIFKLKDGVSGDKSVRYKARLVAKGFTQKEGIDFNEVFSPVVKHSSIRVLLAITVFFDLKLDQMDVKTAFLHGSLEEEILMTQPEGFVEEGTEDMVCLLKKSLYGLKQSPRQWYLRFDEFMLSHNFNRKEINKLKAKLMAVFEMKDLGPAAKILGMQIKRDRHAKTLFLTQTGYLKKVVNRFGMMNSKSVTTPVATHFKLSKQHAPKKEADIDHMRRIPYSSAVGSIMYAMVCTRPDVAYGIGLVSRFMGNPSKEYWEAVKWLLRYLRGTEGHGVMFGQVSNASSKVLGNKIRSGVINVIKIPTEVNPADMLTKPIPTVKFRNSLDLIGVINFVSLLREETLCVSVIKFLLSVRLHCNLLCSSANKTLSSAVPDRGSVPGFLLWLCLVVASVELQG
ncbi:hypothetical protein KPL71_013868 [Citrus sinensis]|uniref:Uncharacterized protein n=1 Tax=Citrus sinensis TaxID=2711 RepID=A0ACB8K6U3_CITSI|nr:hypothetical protein KPL71_013868 [Citrus sinensis]